MEELKQSLLAATMELEVSKEELRRKEQSIAELAGFIAVGYGGCLYRAGSAQVDVPRPAPLLNLAVAAYNV